jgi:hypothetical protein
LKFELQRKQRVFKTLRINQKRAPLPGDAERLRTDRRPWQQPNSSTQHHKTTSATTTRLRHRSHWPTNLAAVLAPHLSTMSHQREVGVGRYGASSKCCADQMSLLESRVFNYKTNFSSTVFFLIFQTLFFIIASDYIVLIRRVYFFPHECEKSRRDENIGSNGPWIPLEKLQ